MAQTPERRRLLIFVIAYHAESTLAWVLDRIPRQVFDDYDCHVLVVDDSSTDRTVEIGTEYRRMHPELPMTILRNPYNQGYGGNQKIGYAYAIAEGFDFVAMVHGDGQYAPEALPQLVRPLRDGEADAVFGSRMMRPFAALKGGMPLYKYVGNKILTRLQNTLLGTDLSEMHSGYRIYSVAALEKIPFQLNTNDFHFDTEIIIQLVNAGLRIVELPIPTYYGDEICRVNGMRYARDVLVATLRNTLHLSGLMYQRKFDVAERNPRRHDLKLGYDSSDSYALEAIPDGATVLDIGSGPGGIDQELAKKGCRVTAVDQFRPTLQREALRVEVEGGDKPFDAPLGDADYLLLLDVIEHLQEPERFLEEMRRQFDFHKRTLILTTPNVAFIVPRLMLLIGQFNYGRAGILDRSHKRLLTFTSARQMLLDAGFRIRRERGVPAPFPKVLGNGLLGRAAVALNRALIKLAPTLFAYQIYLEAETTPDVSYLLGQARVDYDARAEVERRKSGAR